MTEKTIPSKRSQLIALLERADGATLENIMAMTGWQVHSCRAALTGLKKSGYRIENEATDKGRRYRITAKPGGK